MNKKILGIAMISLVLVFLLLVLYKELEEKKVIDEKRKVSTIFGCVELKDTYTPEQWEAKQKFMQRYTRGAYVEC